MYITRIYLGSKRLQLLQVEIPGEKDLHRIENIVELRPHPSTSIDKSFEDMSKETRSFYINIKNQLTKNYKNDLPVVAIIKRLYKSIMNKNTKTIYNLKKVSDLNKYTFVLYVGYKNKKDRLSREQPSRVALFPLKKKLMVKKSKINVIEHDSRFIVASNRNTFQLPADKSDNIANLYIRNKYNSKLEIYKPLSLDRVFETEGFKKKYISNIFDRFNQGFKRDKNNPGVTLTEDNMTVSFVKSSFVDELRGTADKQPSKYNMYLDKFNNSSKYQRNEKDDVNIKNKMIFNNKNPKKKEYLMNCLSMFTGNGHSTIQTVSKYKFDKALFYLRHNTSSKYNANDVPYVPNKSKVKNYKKEIFVTAKSIPIFCSLIQNKIFTRVLTQHVDIPYYQL